MGFYGVHSFLGQFDSSLIEGRHQFDHGMFSFPGQGGGTHPSHALDAYTGDFEHPGYGTVSILLDGEQLKATFNAIIFPLMHYHYDIFEATFERFDLQVKVSFSTNIKGDIESVAIPFEPTAKEIIFKRVASKEMAERSFLEQFVGVYEFFLGRSIIITLRGEKSLVASIPGQPDYELEPYKGLEFQIKGLSGFSLEFKKDTSGVTEVMITQPYGVVNAKKKM